MQEVFAALGIGDGMQVFAYDDQSGSFAARLWWMLRYLGHTAVAVLDGGWKDWLAQDYPVEAGPRHPEPAAFTARPQPGLLLQAEAVSSVSCLVDSRDPARYRGEAEPVDPVAGHIPGALNYFWRNNLDAQGRFRSPAELKRQLLSLFGSGEPAEAAFYCGSGVTACHNLLAAVHAGLAMPRLYAGSWSEWCADPARPVARNA
jgi:thiosulfate/3-mercaptopyruvate sulfurtransferase